MPHGAAETAPHTSDDAATVSFVLGIFDFLGVCFRWRCMFGRAGNTELPALHTASGDVSSGERLLFGAREDNSYCCDAPASGGAALLHARDTLNYDKNKTGKDASGAAEAEVLHDGQRN